MRVLVTGAGGFVGPHLIRHIASVQPNATIFGSVLNLSDSHNLPNSASYHRVDLLNFDAVVDLLSQTKPDVIYHLAGQSSPSKALNSIWRTIETNVRIQLNLFQACLELNITPRFILISSGEIYCGGAAEQGIMPVNENAALRPGNPYALSKVTQDLMGLEYFLSYQLPVIRVRPFNHTGPGQKSTFVAPDFALQIAKIELGLQEPIMQVGNLDAKRDFTDVRDVVRAYYLLNEKGVTGQAYNVASNRAYSIQYLLDTLLSFTSSEITIATDPTKFRPVDVPLVQGDYSRLQQLTGWQPTISFEQTLHDLLEDCRERVQRMMRSNQ